MGKCYPVDASDPGPRELPAPKSAFQDGRRPVARTPRPPQKLAHASRSLPRCAGIGMTGFSLQRSNGRRRWSNAITGPFPATGTGPKNSFRQPEPRRRECACAAPGAGVTFRYRAGRSMKQLCPNMNGLCNMGALLLLVLHVSCQARTVKPHENSTPEKDVDRIIQALAVPPLTESQVAVVTAKLSQIKFPIDQDALHDAIGLDRLHTSLRHRLVKDGTNEWCMGGFINSNRTVRYRMAQGIEGHYAAYEIREVSTYAIDLTGRAIRIGNRMRDEAVQGTITSFIQSSDFPDVVIMPSRVTETLARLGTNMVNGTVSAEETANEFEATHSVTISSSTAHITIPLKYDAECDQFHIVPGFTTNGH
jgi:hypothetical protein